VAGSLFEAYVAGEAHAFFPTSFLSASDRQKAVARAVRPLAPDVLAGLEAQNARFGSSAARSAQLAQLARGAATVVTGQQVGLFLGPLYTVYKAASAIRVARALAAQSGEAVVPVFWLQTEDHDLVEIATCTLLCPDHDPLRLQLPAATDNRVSIAHLWLPEDITRCLSEVAAACEGLPQARDHLTQLTRHYRPGASWSGAFAGLLAELFEPEGLLLMDPRDAAFAREATVVHERAITGAKTIATALLAQSARLQAAGFTPTVHVRDAAPLSFYHPGRPDAPRHRLQACGTEFVEIDSEARHSAEELLATLAREPLCFSTSALLRPILQDALLPTAAYVGGPAEVAYFAQLPPLYAAFGLQMPLIVPRARVRVIEAASARLLKRLELVPDALAHSEEALLRELAQRDAQAGQQPDAGQFERKLVEGLERVLDSTLAEVAPQLPQLTASSAKTRAKLRLTAHKLGARYATLLAHADQQRIHDVRRLKRWLQPQDQPQERVYGLCYFAARYGARTFIENVLHSIEPFEPHVKDLVP
jgi:bacillithiol biosynthesis cysteine-adding enzyme BshC